MEYDDQEIKILKEKVDNLKVKLEDATRKAEFARGILAKRTNKIMKDINKFNAETLGKWCTPEGAKAVKELLLILRMEFRTLVVKLKIYIKMIEGTFFYFLIRYMFTYFKI